MLLVLRKKAKRNSRALWSRQCNGNRLPDIIGPVKELRKTLGCRLGDELTKSF